MDSVDPSRDPDSPEYVSPTELREGTNDLLESLGSPEFKRYDEAHPLGTRSSDLGIGALDEWDSGNYLTAIGEGLLGLGYSLAATVVEPWDNPEDYKDPE